MIPASESVKLLTSSLKGMKLSANEAISVVDKLTKLDMKSATSAQELAQALSKVANSARLAKVSQDEILGILSVGIETTQQSGDVIGTAVRSLLARFSNVKASKFGGSGEETEGTLNDTEAVLSKIGIRIRNASGEMRSFMDVLDDVAEKWDTLDDVSRNAISTAMAGTRQKEIFASIIENYDRVKELIGESANAAGTADEKYSAYMDSMEAATKRLQNAWEGFTQSLETSTVMKFLTNTTAAMVENADKLKYIVTGIAAASSARIFDFFTNKGETGGWKGLVANIPFIGRGTKTNNILESIDKKVGDIRGEVKKDKSGVTKNGGLISRLMSGRKQYKADKAFVKKDVMQAAAMAASKEAYLSQAKKVNALRVMSEDIGGPLSDFDEMQEAQIMQQQYEEEKKILQEKRQQYKAQEAISKTNKEEVKLAKARIATQKKLSLDTFKQTAAISGIATLATQLLTTKEVGTGIGGWAGKLITGNRGNQQTLEETAGDKALRTGFATAGSIAGAASALIPVVGPAIAPIVSAIGSVVGEGIGGLLSTWFRADELAMKQRVADAKENLNRLDAIKSTMETNNSIMTEELTSSEDFEKLYEYTDDLYDKLFELQYEGNVDIIGAINNAYETFKGVENITSIRDLCDEINNGNAEQRSMIKRQLELAEAQANLEELTKSQEEERAEVHQTLAGDIEGEGFWSALWKNFLGNDAVSVSQEKKEFFSKLGFTANTLMGDRSILGSLSFDNQNLSAEEKYEKVEDLLDQVERSDLFTNEEKSVMSGYIEKYLKDVDKAFSKSSKLDKQLVKARSNVGFLAADIHDLTTTELKDLTMDGVVGLVVKALEAQGVEVRNAAGYIKDEYQDAIEKLIKSDSKFNALQQADTKTLEQLTDAQKRFTDAINEGIEEWDKWYDRAQRGDLESYAKNLGIEVEELEKIIYAANPERIKQLASAWNTTVEGIKDLADEFPDLTTAIGLMSPSDVREYYAVFSDFFDDLVTDSTLTAENFEKLLNTYPQLLKYYKGGTLDTTLFTKFNKEQQIAYANALLSTELSSSGTSREFLAAIKDYSEGKITEENKRLVALTKDNVAGILKEVGSVKSLNEVLEKANKLRQEGKEEEAANLENLVSQYMDYERTIEWINPIYEQAKQAEIDLLSKQIENLNEQKNALSNVNDERQRELNLIKAKEALENARKEKKRVFRSGLGFVMESDEEAIATAQENLDKLNVEKQQEDIQYQIDQVELLKSMLENLDEEKQKEANLKALKQYFGGSESPLNLSSSEMVSKLIDGFSKNYISFNTGKGEIKDSDGNIIWKGEGEGAGVSGAMAAIGEKTEKAKEELVGKDGSGGAVGAFNEAKNEFDKLKEKIGTKEYQEAAYKYIEAKENLEEKLSAAKNAGVDTQTIENGAELIRGYKEPTMRDWKRVDGVKNPSSVKGRMVKKKEHDVMLNTNSPLTSDEVSHEFGDNKSSKVKIYDAITDSYSEWESLGNTEIASLPDYTIIMNAAGDDSYAWVKGGMLYWLRGTEANAPAQEDGTWGGDWATGTTSAPEGLSLINELGTEAIITPGGTLTALPSKTGIVPADITKNVWALGEVAPTLIAQLGSITQKIPTGSVSNTTYEEGQYFDNFTMNVYPTKDYDMDKLLAEARSKIRLTRHSS